MATITPKQQPGGINMCAFLDLIGWSEGTTTSPHTLNDGYDVIVQGVDGAPDIFHDYSKHPNILVLVSERSGLKSTAAGRYQILSKYAKAYIKQLGLPDFSPLSQDYIAIQLIRECGALDLVRGGYVQQAIYACRSRWASFPGANYAGQNSHPMPVLAAKFAELLKAYRK